MSCHARGPTEGLSTVDGDQEKGENGAGIGQTGQITKQEEKQYEKLLEERRKWRNTRRDVREAIDAPPSVKGPHKVLAETIHKYYPP